MTQNIIQIYVIDSCDRKRFDETAEELSELLNEDKLDGGNYRENYFISNCDTNPDRKSCC